MLGTYRLCLALLVALSHVEVSVAGLNPGVVAVVGFYMASGYVMTAALRSHYQLVRAVPYFYGDRVLRLFPHYLALACTTYAWLALTGLHTEYASEPSNVGNVVQNVLIVPLNYYMFNHADRFTLVPPAWSLGAELQFYAVIPFLLLFAGPRARGVALAASLAIYLVASFGYINTDWYGYRLLPGVLFMFLIGSWLYDSDQQVARGPRARSLCIGVVAVASALAVLLAHAGKLALPYNRETLFGLAAGAVAVSMLAHRRRRRIDDAIGNLSYGVFLNHFLVLWLLFDGRVKGVAGTFIYLVVSLVIALLLYHIVERPMLGLRRRLRISRSNTPIALAPSAPGG
jgi:peptidoglycan/LPS O-acetylase OafA/YrhL